MKDTEIINFYNNLDQYAKDKIDIQLIDLTNAKKEYEEKLYLNEKNVISLK